jgi:2-oxoglutarate ferredoxin oxidoreductase subunit alpha
MQLRIKEGAVSTMTKPLDLLVALDSETAAEHLLELKPTGLLIADRETLKIDNPDPRIIDLPMRKMAMEHGGKPLFANTAALGCIAGLVEFGMDGLKKLFQETFPKSDLAEKNLAVAEAGFEFARTLGKGRFAISMPHLPNPKPRMFVNGNEAIALGAAAADCRYMAAYPMSPSTSIIMYLAEIERRIDMVTDQAEDEIAAVNLAFGAAMGGVRSMTATSGGGMALMSETISLSGAAEVPLVIVDCQRPGPATGLPTRTDQSDLMFAIYTGHGEFTRAVLAPGNAEEAFFDTVLAFNLAEQYQIPVIVLAEQYLSESFFTVEPFDLSKVERKTSLLSDEQANALPEYKRYALTKSGVSPRLYPGQSRHLILTDSHEHDEDGHITEEIAIRNDMVAKRLVRSSAVVNDCKSPEILQGGDAEIMFVGWGTVRETLFEAATLLSKEGMKAGVCYYHHLWPFPEDRTLSALAERTRIIAVEGNGTGQLAGLLKQYLGRNDIESILKTDGRPFFADELYTEMKKAVNR